MNSPPPKLQAARAWLLEQSRRLWAAIKRHPIRAALALPALMLLYVLVLIPFTPSIGDLRKAKSATPSRRVSNGSRSSSRAVRRSSSSRSSVERR